MGLFSMKLLLLIGICIAPVSTAFGDPKPNPVTIATWNVEWFFDAYTGNNSSDLSKQQSAPSQAEWDWKLEHVARVIGTMRPTILALQEVENRQVIRQLTKKLKDKYDLRFRIAYIEGWDNFTEQDVAIIYQNGLVQYSCREQTYEMFKSRDYYSLNKHIFGQFEWGTGDDKQSLTLINVHLRAMPEKHDLRQKQCRLIRHWIEDKVESGENVLALGDFNTEEVAGAIRKNSDLAILSGWQTEDKSDDLYDLHEFLNAENRSTHLAGRQFDRILVSQPLLEDKQNSQDLVFSKISIYKNLVVVGSQDKDHFNQFYTIPRDQRDISDHYPVMAEFVFK